MGAMLSITSVCKASVGYQRDSYEFICGFKWNPMESMGSLWNSMEIKRKRKRKISEKQKYTERGVREKEKKEEE